MPSANSKQSNYCYAVPFFPPQIHTVKIKSKRLKCKNK